MIKIHALVIYQIPDFAEITEFVSLDFPKSDLFCNFIDIYDNTFMRSFYIE